MMLLTHTFAVDAPTDEAWRVLLDLPRIAPCLPGAAVTSVDGDDYRGGVKIKIGPVTVRYEGVARFVEVDEEGRRAVLEAKGKDVGGQGNANARITLTLDQQGEGTLARVDTELELSGRVAQFGRGVIADVTSRLIAQFVRNLEAEILDSGPQRLDVTPSKEATAVRPSGSLDDVEPLDVMGSMSGVLTKYALPAITGVLLLSVAATWAARGSWRRPQAAPVSLIHLFVHISPAPALGGPGQGVIGLRGAARHDN